MDPIKKRCQDAIDFLIHATGKAWGSGYFAVQWVDKEGKKKTGEPSTGPRFARPQLWIPADHLKKSRRPVLGAVDQELGKGDGLSLGARVTAQAKIFGLESWG